MHRRGRPLASLSSGTQSLALVAAVALTGLVGCGEEEFSDEAYGAIDLAPYFFDGSNAANPTAGLPRDIIGKRGWVEGKRAEFYDFGLVSFTRKRNAQGTTLAEPDTARANPIYFFYDSQGRPMFSRPIFDKRTGTFHMRGGKDVLNPNPRNPRTQAEERRAFDLPYSARARNTVVDPGRNSDDYQRPIIDVLHNSARYAGVWEIIEVKVNDSGYVPDSIKSAKTLEAARAAGKLTFRPTGKVINCPVLDDRTWVTPSSMRVQLDPEPFMPVQPRIELWFRTKLGSCFLANGWETIGRTVRDGEGPLLDPRQLDDNNGLTVNLELFSYNTPDDERVDTFDVIRFNVGTGKNVVRTVAVPIGKHYIPKVTVANPIPGGAGSDIRYAGDDLQTARPRHFGYQQPGYTPLVWLHDITVPQDPPYQGGAFKRLTDADPQRVAARTGVFVKNFPVAGIASPCRADGDGDCGGGGGKASPFGLTCNRFPDIDLATTAPPSGKNIADMIIEREGGPRCDVQAVGFGEYCAPGVSRCATHLPDGDPNLPLLTGEKPKFAAAGPGFTMPTDAKADYYRANGYHKSYQPRGYACHPSTGGYCYVRCDGSVSAGNPRDAGYKKGDNNDGDAYGTGAADVADLDKKLSREFVIKTGPRTENTKVWKFNYDARCGGTALLGYQCVSTRPNAQRVCLRECTPRNTDKENAAICGYRLNDDGSSPARDGKFQGAITFGAGQPAVEDPGFTYGIETATCNTLQGATACTWNPDFEPRGPAYAWPQ